MKIITDKGRNFESKLIENLCLVAGVKILRTIPYHPQTNWQCEHFNSKLLNMLDTLTPEQKEIGKVMYLPWFILTTAVGMQPLGLVHIISFSVGRLDSLWMYNLVGRREARRVFLVNQPTSHN